MNPYVMRRSSVALMVLLLLTSSAPAIDAASKGVISCTPADLEMIPASWDIDDGACVRVDLGVLSAGDTLSFDVTADSQVDILLFAAGSISVYQNEQNYRLDSVWHADSVFESFQGDGTWHWTAPDDRGDTRWYLVLDNMAHPQDQGNGAQGGSLDDVVKYGMNKDCGLLINSSRSIIYAGHGENFADNARKAALKIKLEMENYLS